MQGKFEKTALANEGLAADGRLAGGRGWAARGERARGPFVVLLSDYYATTIAPPTSGTNSSWGVPGTDDFTKCLVHLRMKHQQGQRSTENHESN
jgi:hypothetical protein